MKVSLLLTIVLLVWGTRTMNAQDVEPQSESAAAQAARAENAEAEQTENVQRGRSRGSQAKQQVTERFNRTAPQVGDLLPDIAAFDSLGNPVRLSDLQGHYTVLTFGCLT